MFCSSRDLKARDYKNAAKSVINRWHSFFIHYRCAQPQQSRNVTCRS